MAIVPYVVGEDEEEDKDGNAGLATLLARGPSPVVDAPVVLNRQATASDPDDLPAAPKYMAPDAAAGKAISARISADSQVTNPDDPSVKPSIGRRIAAGLAAAAMQFGHVPGAFEAGQGIVTAKFDQAEAARRGRLAADQQDLQGYKAQQAQGDQDYARSLGEYSANLQAYKDRTGRQKEEALEQQRLGGVDEATLAPDDAANPLGTWHGANLRGEPVTGIAAPDKFLKTPAGVMAVRGQEADRLSLAGDDRKFYMANGKLAEPKPITNIRVPRQPSEGEQAYGDAKAAWTAQNPGKRPTMSDLMAIRRAADGKDGGADGADVPRGTPNQFATVTRQTMDAYGKAKAAYNKALEDDPSPSGRTQAEAELKAENDRIAAENSQRTRDLGGIPKEDAAPALRTAAAAAPVPKPMPPATPQQVTTTHTKQAVKVGDSVTVGGKQYRVAGINPQTGKPILSQ